MDKKRIYIFLLVFLFAVQVSLPAYAFQGNGTGKTDKGKAAVQKRQARVPTEQEKGSLEVFNELLDVIESTSDRQSILPKIEELYMKIITQYPEAPLAQESYWKLLTVYVEEYSPPAYDKAETLYSNFLDGHPKSVLKKFLVEALGKSYYRNAMWDKLLGISAPVFKEYTETQKRVPASILFMYSEANYNLGNIEEAEKGYQIVSEKFPRLVEGKKSESMLEKISKDR